GPLSVRRQVSHSPAGGLCSICSVTGVKFGTSRLGTGSGGSTSRATCDAPAFAGAGGCCSARVLTLHASAAAATNIQPCQYSLCIFVGPQRVRTAQSQPESD